MTGSNDSRRRSCRYAASCGGRLDGVVNVASSPAADTQSRNSSSGCTAPDSAQCAEQRLVAVDRLQHQEVGDLRRRASPGRRHAAAERLAALMQQPEELGHERVAGEAPARASSTVGMNVSSSTTCLSARHSTTCASGTHA